MCKLQPKIRLLPDHEGRDDLPEAAFDREHRPQAYVKRHANLLLRRHLFSTGVATIRAFSKNYDSGT